MKIRMAKSHGSYKPGEIVDLPERQARSLIAWEYATEIRESQQTLIETASVDYDSERAEMTPRRHKK